MYKVVGVRLPHVWRCMLLERIPRVGSYEFESALGVGPDRDTGAYLSKGRCGFVDLDVDVIML